MHDPCDFPFCHLRGKAIHCTGATKATSSPYGLRIRRIFLSSNHVHKVSGLMISALCGCRSSRSTTFASSTGTKSQLVSIQAAAQHQEPVITYMVVFQDAVSVAKVEQLCSTALPNYGFACDQVFAKTFKGFSTTVSATPVCARFWPGTNPFKRHIRVRAQHRLWKEVAHWCSCYSPSACLVSMCCEELLHGVTERKSLCHNHKLFLESRLVV